MAIKHLFESEVPDGGNSSLVQPSDWNEPHVIETTTVTPATGDKLLIKDVSDSENVADVLISALATLLFASPTLTGTPLVPTASPGTNTTQAASTAFVIAEILARIASLDVMVFKGVIDCSANPNYPAADAGHTYRVSVGGKIGGASGVTVSAGDLFICHTDSTASGNQATVGANWDVIKIASGFTTSNSTDTFTNKTIDPEATGNVIGMVEKQWLPAAGVNGATAAPMWDLPASGAPTPTVVTGSNVIKGTLSFPDSGASSAQITLKLPSDWSGAIDVKILWKTSATSGNCKWTLATSFGALNAAEVDDQAFNTAQTVTTAAPGTANRTQESDIASLTTTGGSAGELFHLKISRDGTDGSDTIGAAAELIGVEITWRRTI